MTIEMKMCFFAVCDGCRDSFENGDGWVAHFGSEAEALTEVNACDGFTTAEGKHYCAECIANAQAPDEARAAAKARDEEDQRLICAARGATA